MIRITKDSRIFLLFGLMLLLSFVIPCSAEAESWMQLNPTGGPPSPRTEHTAVYDPASNRMIVFGGFDSIGFLNEVWVLTNANGLGGTPNWIQLSPTGGPPSARTLHTAIYDPTTNRMIVFGGNWIMPPMTPLDDVWVLTNANGLGGTPNWIQLSPTGGPPSARERHTAVYDLTSNRMTIFAGRSSFSNDFGDVWVLTNANGLGGTPNWIQLSPTGGPPSARILHTAVYDQDTNRMTVFAGRSSSGSLNDLWVLTNANGLGGTPNWIQLSPTGGPPSARTRHTAVYDSTFNQMLIFAGTPEPYLNDVWVLTSANGLGGTPNWTQLSPAGGPPGARSATSAVYDASNRRMVVFGGWACNLICEPVYNDVWVLLNASSAQAQAVPTMTEWGMIILAGLLGIGSVYYLRRSRLAT